MFQGGGEDSEMQQDGGASTTSLDHVHHQATPIFMFENKKMEKTLEFPFSYNVSSMPNVQQKERFDQNFSYNYPTVVMGQMAAAQTMGTAPTTVYKCEICGAMFAHPSLLAHHKKDHAPHETQPDNIVLYICNICNASFSQSSDLKIHVLSQHSQQNEPPPPPPMEEKKKLAKLEPNENKVCRTTQNTTTQTGAQSGQPQYQKGFYPVKKRRMTTVAKCYKCDGTGIVFVNEPDPLTEVVPKQRCEKPKVKRQNAPNDKPFRCNICLNTFSRYSSLWSHKKLHSGEKPFKCEICGLAFARSSSLKNHTRVHTGERPYKCDVCGMQFSQAPHLKNHERIHSGERPYECDICNKTFSRHSTLWNHRRIHTGEKPYGCEICGASFNQASHLKNHAKVHTGEKPYRCDICDVSFSDRFTLKRHCAIHDKSRATALALNAQAAWKHNNAPISPNILPNIKQGQTTQTDMGHFN